MLIHFQVKYDVTLTEMLIERLCDMWKEHLAPMDSDKIEWFIKTPLHVKGVEALVGTFRASMRSKTQPKDFSKHIRHLSGYFGEETDALPAGSPARKEPIDQELKTILDAIGEHQNINGHFKIEIHALYQVNVKASAPLS